MYQLLLRLAGVVWLCFGFSFTVQAQWQLDNSQSKLHFVSIKSSAVAETHTFKKLVGQMTEQGAASVTIELATVDTKIDIRDQRMNQYLFEAVKFPQAKVTTQVEMAALANLKAGESKTVEQTFNVDLHGHQISIVTKCLVARLAGNQIRVSSVEPLLVNASQFGLLKGIEKLRELAGLPSIATAVPVTFSLVFTR